MKKPHPGLHFLHLIEASALALLLMASSASAANIFGSNSSNISIPDNGGWVRSSITISGAPSGATVTGIDVHFSAVHAYSGDLNVDLNDSGLTRNYDLWSNEGGAADNPSRTVYGITTFNGLAVNGTWHLYAKDTAPLDAGYIDEWWIRIYYADATTTYAVYARINNLAYGTDEDSDGYYETFNFQVCVDGDASPGPADVHARMISVATSQAWWSVNSWTVQGTATDYKCFAFDETDFAGNLNGNTDLDFTVELWNAAKTTRFATDTSVTGEPVKADRANNYAVYGKVDPLVYGTDQDADGYYETFDFQICLDGDASPGPATIYGRIISVTTNQAWWSLVSWNIQGTATDYHCFAFDESDFTGKITGNTNLDFTVEVWNSAKTIKLATDTTLLNEPVKADYVAPSNDSGPRIGTGTGVLGDAKSHIDTYFNDGILFFNEYRLDDRARRAALNPHAHNGRMQSTAKIETSRFNASSPTQPDPMADLNNAWNGADQRSGVDAHVYAGQVYDYLNRELGLNGPDNGGQSMKTIVEVGAFSSGASCRDNAFWSGSSVGYCIPLNAPSFAGAVDIVGHEWGHALTDISGANFNSTAEPGALDEAFSDWLGAAVVDHYNAGDPWIHGGAVVPGGNRNMADPPALHYGTVPYPDTYEGVGWWDPSDCSFDACGRHINATVADKMFYLLSEGGTHNNIEVSGLDVQTAIKIARDANLTHWNATSNFTHARQGMILAAGGYSSSAVDQVRNAWAAVHVGAPASDDFNRAQGITGSSGRAYSSNRGGTKQSGEPNHAGNVGGKSVWFTWTAPGTGRASFDTHTSSFDTLLAIYTGTSVSALTFVAGNDDDGSAGLTSGLAFDTTGGTVYRIAADGYTGAEGDVVLNYSWSSLPTLTGLSIQGSSSVDESSAAAYTATANWSDGTSSQVSASWSENSIYASISSAGLLTTSSVTSNQIVTITATYTTRGVTKTATKAVTIMNTSRVLTGLTISGPSVVSEQNSVSYAAIASWSDGSTSTVAATWSENSIYCSINPSGVLTTSAISSTQTVTLTASYSADGVTKTSNKTVTILDQGTGSMILFSDSFESGSMSRWSIVQGGG